MNNFFQVHLHCRTLTSIPCLISITVWNCCSFLFDLYNSFILLSILLIRWPRLDCHWLKSCYSSANLCPLLISSPSVQSFLRHSSWRMLPSKKVHVHTVFYGMAFQEQAGSECLWCAVFLCHRVRGFAESSWNSQQERFCYSRSLKQQPQPSHSSVHLWDSYMPCPGTAFVLSNLPACLGRSPVSGYSHLLW